MTNHTITVGEAINLINDSILSFEDGLPSDTISKIIYSINNEIQVRDYFLGLPETFGLDTCLSFLSYIGASIDEDESYSIATLMSAYFYEKEEVELAAISLELALKTKPNYSLANLLDRVFTAGWSADSFVSMRKELHPRVVAGLEEMKDQLILI